ncbi:MAG: alkaline phosphatase [Verrucomicrobiales bacterium]|nr:alkaline phosphatase [Verrucomicrobiales bacterium]
MKLLQRYLPLATLLAIGGTAIADPVIVRLTPPSKLFSLGVTNGPVIARFLPEQRFDLQSSIRPDPGMTIDSVEFQVDEATVSGVVTLKPGTGGVATNLTIGTLRAFETSAPGVHSFSVRAVQSDGKVATASGNFEVAPIAQRGRRARNVIFCIGDGMGIAHRTAARLMKFNASMGKANGLLAMDQMPFSGLVMTHSLNSIVTDSSPGAACYSTGNKANNNQHGVFPDDTTDNFDNPRVENVGEYLHRTQGKALGIVTTSDVFDATPAAFATHTQSRAAGSGICDQYLDESGRTGLSVLLGGGRKWFLPATTPGSGRTAATDYALADELASGWAIPVGQVDTNRDLIADFEAAGWRYAADRTSLAATPADTRRLLGLFSFSNMNVAKDKIDGRRGAKPAGATSSVVEDFGLPDQPMLDEMTDKALQVLSRNANGFVLMVEAASIDKQAHNMDTERWILDTIEFDAAIGRCLDFARTNSDTLVIVTADHECAGVNIIGGSRVAQSVLTQQLAQPSVRTTTYTNAVGGFLFTFPYSHFSIRTNVGTYEAAGFPKYVLGEDGYPVTTDIDGRMIVGYAANADRFEDYLTNPYPLRDSQQPFVTQEPQLRHPGGPSNRDFPTGNFLTGQIPDAVAAHTASDVPVSAQGRGASAFTGVMDNTDVFFRAMQAVVGGAQ